jgi:competence protein ComEC
VNPDLRLALPAIAAWVVAWQGRLLSPLVLVCLSLAALATGGVFLVLQRFVVAAVLLCAAASGVVTSLHVHTRTTGPLFVAAARQAAVTIEGVLLDDPRVIPARGDVLSFRTLVVAKVRVERLIVAGQVLRLRQAVLVLGSDTHLLGLLPSQHLKLEGRLQPAAPGDDVAALLSARGPPVVVGRPSLLQRVAGRLRQGLRDAVAPLPADQRGLLPGLVDGDTSQLDPRLNDDFRTTGLTHLTAVSGTNVGVVLSAALLLCVWLSIGLRWRAPLAGAVLVAFVVLARPQPSVLRAAVMGAIALLALGTGSQRQAFPALSATVLLLILVSPDLASSPGFALSTLATGALLLVAPVWRARLARRMPVWAAEALAVPAAAQVACTPVVVALSGSLGLLAVPANLLAVPAVAPATVLGVVAALVAPICLPVAQGLAWLAWLPTWWLTTIAHVGAGQPGAATRLPTGWLGAVLSLSLLLAIGVILRSPRLRRAAAAATAGVVLTVVGLVLVHPGWPPPGWLLVSCDVGQGDSFVVRLPGDDVLVVDSGPDPRAVDQCLTRLGIDRVALLVLTHLHADHVEGVPGVLRGRQVAQVEIGPLDEPAVERARLLGWLGARGVPVVRAQIGEVRTAGQVSWEVLDATARRGTDSDPNNSSIVLRLVTHGVSVLFTGDLEGDAQASLRERGVDLHADILKVPHHGSAKQDPAFLDAVGARVALTPVGAGNPYGHPAMSTLSRLAKDGARVYRSDRDGDVAIVLRNGAVQAVGRGGDGMTAPSVAVHRTAPLSITSVHAIPVLGVPVDLCDAVARAPPSVGETDTVLAVRSAPVLHDLAVAYPEHGGAVDVHGLPGRLDGVEGRARMRPAHGPV